MGIFEKIFNTNGNKAKESDIDSLYAKDPSFTDLLPYAEYLPETKCFLLDDGLSVGAMFDIKPISTEGKSEAYLNALEENLRNVVTHSIPQKDDPYVVQVFVRNSASLSQHKTEFHDYIKPEVRESSFSQDFLKHYSEHLTNVENPEGYFIDDAVSGSIWNGQVLQVKVFIYRKVKPIISKKNDVEVDYEQELNEVCEKFQTQVHSCGVGISREGGEQFFYYMLDWFNRNPEIFGGSNDALKEALVYPGDTDLPFGHDFAKMLTITEPKSCAETGTWNFDGILHKAISVENLLRPPVPGHLTGERRIGDHLFSVFDKMPSGTNLCITIVVEPQDTVVDRITSIRNGAKGEDAEAELTLNDAKVALTEISNGNSLFPVIITAFVIGDTYKKLRKNIVNTNSLLLTHGLHAVDEKNDLVPIDNYIKLLPMSYDVSREKVVNTSRLMYSNHIARIIPFYGRETGTGNHGLNFFNRGGSPLSFDPLNKSDRVKNAFGLVLGPPGSGKSALMVYILMQLVAIYNVRVFIIEKGGSFTLFGEYCKSHGLTVNQVPLHPKNNVSLPPFIEAIRMLEVEEKKANKINNSSDIDSFIEQSIDEDDSDDEEERDFLGEMELSARVMITGGDKKEEDKLSRSDRLLIRKAIVNAAIEKRVKSGAQPTVLAEDVAKALYDLGNESSRRASSSERAHEMAEAMELFCSGTNGHFFNRDGVMFPESDITILEMGILANVGYEDGLALGFMSLMNIITGIVERDQFKSRPTIVLGDEAHLFTTNPLLAPYIVKIVKMYRKLGAWLWLATQNLEDFPDDSRKMLSMFEWFIAMTCPKEQVELISEFRDLSDEQRSMLLAASKSPRKYTEGVVCSEKLTALFRNVPPAICLALAMTDKDEKSQRHEIMDELGCSELEACIEVANKIANPNRVLS